ncbi:hypothetical protein A9Q81_19285 [Gammaproteobacteria bacterium 42_54_T18]|nr:hypothetical protein A9Q81_19285 [Gammaproteobacteria bacterium 42_54_T18]
MVYVCVFLIFSIMLLSVDFFVGSHKIEYLSLVFWQFFANTPFERGQTPYDGAAIGREAPFVRHHGVASEYHTR